MLPTIQIGPVSIPTSTMILLVGFWLSLSLAEKYSSRRGISAIILNNLVLISVIVGILSSRFVFIIRYPSAFEANPLSAIYPNPNMLDPLGGVAGVLLTALIYINRKQLNYWQVLDAITPLLSGMMVAMSLANLASGDAFGVPTNLPWAIDLWNAKRHPTQVYDTIAASIIMFILWPARSWLSHLKPGGLFLSFLVLSSFTKLVTEAVRGDSTLFLNQYRGIQFLYLGILLLSLWCLRSRLPNHNQQNDLDD